MTFRCQYRHAGGACFGSPRAQPGQARDGCAAPVPAAAAAVQCWGAPHGCGGQGRHDGLGGVRALDTHCPRTMRGWGCNLALVPGPGQHLHEAKVKGLLDDALP